MFFTVRDRESCPVVIIYMLFFFVCSSCKLLMQVSLVFLVGRWRYS